MSKLSLPVTNLIRENISTLVSYAFSRESLQEWADKSLQGEFDNLRDTVFKISAQQAEKACLELALLLRYFDDEEGISAKYKNSGNITFGTLFSRNGKKSELSLRDVANKIIHAQGFEWEFPKSDKPMLVCVSRDSEKWLKAKIDVAAVTVACGSLD